MIAAVLAATAVVSETIVGVLAVQEALATIAALARLEFPTEVRAVIE